VVVWELAGTARERYRLYGGRGDGENRIKEMKEGIGSDRMSCREFASNKVRLMRSSVAYVLLQQWRRAARRTELGRAQVTRLRLCLIKIAARVRESRRRVVVELGSSCPGQQTWRQLASGLGIGRG
jgi:Transposase DDE domain group 1